MNSPALWAGPRKCFLRRNVQISHSLSPPFSKTKVFSFTLKLTLVSDSGFDKIIEYDCVILIGHHCLRKGPQKPAYSALVYLFMQIKSGHHITSSYYHIISSCIIKSYHHIIISSYHANQNFFISIISHHISSACSARSPPWSGATDSSQPMISATWKIKMLKYFNF